MQHKCAIIIKIILNSCNEHLIQGNHLDLIYFIILRGVFHFCAVVQEKHFACVRNAALINSLLII